jgi:hypothetical protein
MSRSTRRDPQVQGWPTATMSAQATLAGRAVLAPAAAIVAMRSLLRRSSPAHRGSGLR